ncbi:MAG: isocitrate lyase/phosphoenolpyruvate mutase family protein [Rhodothermales bacterium]
MLTQTEKANSFVALHERAGAFVIPNPWDVGSARVLAGLGFEALATTSGGFAQTLGRADGMVTLEEKLSHVRQLVGAVDLPLSVDLENGFAHRPEGVAANILKVADAGAVGASIEDHTRDPSNPIYEFDLAVERIHAAVEAAGSLSFPFTLTARSENFLWGRHDLDDTIRRLQAFEAAGADVLYAPRLTTLDEVAAVAGALSKPVNVLGPFVKGATVAQLADAGARRISVGGVLNRAAVSGMIRAAEEMLREGTFTWTNDLATLTF